MDRKRLAAVLAWLVWTASARGDSLGRLPEPGEPGSHERYVEALRQAGQRAADELLERYERRVAEAPDDAVAAMERCLFLGTAFYDPYLEENSREDERAACVQEVEARFPTDPDARVFAIEQR